MTIAAPTVWMVVQMVIAAIIQVRAYSSRDIKAYQVMPGSDSHKMSNTKQFRAWHSKCQSVEGGTPPRPFQEHA
eukprot:5071964-Amphidinium_carterae.2